MEEVLNAVTHGVGAALALAGLVILIVAASIHGSAWHVVSFSIFGSSLFVLYLASTLYHAITNKRAKAVFQHLDHSAIYILIAGSYTPFTLVVLNGWIGWTLFGCIWGMAVAGIVGESLCKERPEKLVTACFIGMGWLVVLAIKPLFNALPAAGFSWLVAGGVLYTVGAGIYLMERMRFNHVIWHLFVLGGSAAHFFTVLFYVVPIAVR